MIMASHSIQNLKEKVEGVIQSLNESNQEYIQQIESILDQRETIYQNILLFNGHEDWKQQVKKKVKIEQQQNQEIDSEKEEEEDP